MIRMNSDDPTGSGDEEYEDGDWAFDADDSRHEIQLLSSAKNAEKIDVSFNFVDFNPDADFHGVRNMIGRSAVFGSLLLYGGGRRKAATRGNTAKEKGEGEFRVCTKDEAADRFSDFADAIAGQVEVGTAVKADDGLFGFATLLDLNAEAPSASLSSPTEEMLKEESEKATTTGGAARKLRAKGGGDAERRAVFSPLSVSGTVKSSVLSFLKRVLTRKCPAERRATFRDRILNKRESGRTVLLVSERVLNFPLQLVPALHENLGQDVAWAKTQDPKGVFASFDKVIVLSPVTQTCDDSGASVMYFDKFEEEIFQSMADFHFTFAMPRGEDTHSATSGARSALRKRNVSGRKKPVVANRRCCVSVLSREKLAQAAQKISTFLA
eukprot:g3091.t1